MTGSDNETINLDEHSENAPVPKMKRKLTSVVWAHFVRFTTGPDKKVKARCKHCKKVFAGGSSCGTSSLKKHLKGRCKALADVDVATIGGAIIFSPKGVSLEFDQERSRADFINMVVKHNLPLNLVEYEYFKIWVNNLQPLYKVMSRNTVRADVLRLYAEEKERIYGVLGKILIPKLHSQLICGRLIIKILGIYVSMLII